ncbi:exopolyphosphatase [bacterium]|nr:exopolyphosphatase [bacterium]
MRLFTRADLDGIVSAALIMRKEEISDILYVHPKDMQDGRIDVQPGDAIANLPFHSNAALWFDHHTGEDLKMPEGVRGLASHAPSAARLVCDYYGFHREPKSEILREMVNQTDRLDAAQLSFEDILHPKEWILLGLMLDPRTGMKLSENFLNAIVEAIHNGDDIETILSYPRVQDELERYIEGEEQHKITIISKTKLKKNICINDLRGIPDIPVGNRFLIYAIFPRCNINMRIMDHPEENDRVIVAVGKSIFYRSHPVHIGELMNEFDGGGLEGAGSCQFYKADADNRIKQLIQRLKD